MNTTETLAPGTILNNRYTILSVLGQGGMSNVYLVEDAKLNSRWALKEMLDVFPDENKTQLLEQFRKEAQILAGMKHPNLPRVFDYFEENNRRYLVMEYIEGKTLQKLIEDEPGVITTEQVVDWAIQICDVLESLHRVGIIYRDLKPGNVMVDQHNRIYLIDFGIARLFTGGKIHDTIIIGTPGYASPEHHGRTETDARSDIFSLGATMHYLLTGNDPGIIPFVFKSPRTVRTAIPEKLSDGVMKALAMDPDERFQTALEMKAYLEQEVIPLVKSTSVPQAPLEKSTSEASVDQERKDADTITPEEPETKPLETPAAAPIPAKGKSTEQKETENRPPFYGEETFTFDPMHAYVYPAIYSSGIISTLGVAAILFSGGVITLPVVAVSALAVVPGIYLYRQAAKYVRKTSDQITVKVTSAGIEITQGRRFSRIAWDEITGLLVFQEKSRVGTTMKKFKISTKRGDFEYDDQIAKVNRFNDIVITHGLLQLTGEGEGYRRYTRKGGTQ